MTLYHGSNVEVKEPKILKPSRGLDFGAGFYTTTNRDQAIAFAGSRRRSMSNSRYNALMTVIVPMVIAEIIKKTGLDEKIATARFYASRVYEEHGHCRN